MLGLLIIFRMGKRDCVTVVRRRKAYKICLEDILKTSMIKKRKTPKLPPYECESWAEVQPNAQ